MPIDTENRGYESGTPADGIHDNQNARQKKMKITASNGWPGNAQYSDSAPAALTRPRPNGKAKLSGLPSLPLDVLYEIFGHLHPLDLLHLARTTKPFRRVLMNKSAMSVWKDARSNIIGLPECPPFLSEPAYANLAFDLHCHNCLTTNVRNVEWKLRVRYCVKCSKICLFPIDNVKKGQETIARCLPFVKWAGRKDTKYCTIKAKDALMKEFRNLDSNEGSRSAFVKQKNVERDAIIAHAKKCEVWADRVQQMRYNELDDLRYHRKKDIEDRLSLLGWRDELDQMPRGHTIYTYGLLLFHEHPLVKQPKVLTDRSWNNIKSEMVDFMEGMKAFRIERERVDILQRRRQYASMVLHNFKQAHSPIVTTPEELTPGAADFWDWPTIAALINSPNEPDITLKQFQDTSETITGFFDSWRRARTQEIVTKLDIIGLPYAKEYPAQLHQIKLAVSVFICRKGLCHNDQANNKPHQYMYYPEYLHHRCNRIRLRDWSDPDEDEPALSLGKGYHQYEDRVVRQQWNSEKLEYDKNASRVIKKILQTCGWDWKTMTVGKLDQLDPRLVCLKCTYGHRCDGERRVSVRSWRSAVVHCMKTHWGSSIVEWEKLSDADAQEARVLEAQSKNGHSQPAMAEWRCAHCQDISQEPERMTQADLYVHLRDEHDVHDERQEGEDYTRAMDVTPRRFLAVEMVPQPMK